MKRAEELARVLRDPVLFAERACGMRLRSYQVEVARAIVDSVVLNKGLTFAVMMSRQSGKNETAALIEAQLLALYAHRGGQIVKAAPTFTPQVVNSMVRLEGKLENKVTGGRWRKWHRHMFKVGRAVMAFYSADAGASVVGATASLLLEGDEAQDIDEGRWNKDFRPMGSSTNATTVLWGTAWTSGSLLSKTIVALRRLEGQDGIRRTFVVPWREVAAEVPAYGRYVEGEIARLGRGHPIIQTQYELVDVDAVSAMFPPQRQELMRGEHAAEVGPADGVVYLMCVDVAGEDAEGESGAGDESARDATAVTIFRVEASETLKGKWRFLVVQRLWWRGVAQAELYNRLLAVEELWRPRRVVIDATGVGAGVASFLGQRLRERVVSFVFSAASKSDLGWAFLAMCDTGRFRDYADDGSLARAEFWRQVAGCNYEMLPGPARRIRWGSKGRQHDDLLISAALCAVLENETSWGRPTYDSFVVEQGDVLDDPAWRAE